MSTRSRRSFFVGMLAISVAWGSTVAANASIVTSGSLTVSFDFTGFTGAGFTPTPGAGQLDSDDWSITGLSDGTLAFGGTGTTGDFARGSSTGGEVTGGMYAFDVGSGNIALGVQPGGTDFTPGDMILKITNNTGSTITAVDYAFDIFVLNDQGRSNSLNFLIDSTAGSTSDAVQLTSLNSMEAAAATPAWASTPFSGTTSGLSILNGADFYVLWRGDDVSGSGSRDEFAIDNLSFTVTRQQIEAVPEVGGLMVWTGLCGIILAGLAVRKINSPLALSGN